MAAHYPNIRWFQAPTIYLSTVHETQTTLQELSAFGYPMVLYSPPGNLGPKRLIGLKTSSATTGTKVAWGLHKFNICDFLDEHSTSAYVIALRRPHT
ncbi:MAG: hypothetical protein ACO2OZ_06530 [Acidilobaceae archaeon]|jgi:hypothetical protein